MTNWNYKIDESGKKLINQNTLNEDYEIVSVDKDNQYLYVDGIFNKIKNMKLSFARIDNSEMLISNVG